MSYFKSDDEFIYLDAPYAEFYIPMDYFDESMKFAEDMGQTIKVMGVFDISIFMSDDDKRDELFKIPTMINLFVHDQETRVVNIPGHNEAIQCKVLKYVQGNKIMSDRIIEDSQNALQFAQFVTKGKLPVNIPYSQSINLWRKNLELNSTHLGVPSVILEMILSGAYRYKNDPTIKFAKIIGKDESGVSEHDYIMASLRRICQYNSTFTAMTYEDIDSMITSSLNRTREKKQEVPSPIEGIIKM